jgi:hypothetical protein
LLLMGLVGVNGIVTIVFLCPWPLSRELLLLPLRARLLKLRKHHSH